MEGKVATFVARSPRLGRFHQWVDVLSACEDASVSGGAVPQERPSPTVRVEREPIRDPWGCGPHPGLQLMGQGFSESSRGIVQGGSHRCPPSLGGCPRPLRERSRALRISILSLLALGTTDESRVRGAGAALPRAHATADDLGGRTVAPARRCDDPTRGGHHGRHLATEPLAECLRAVRLPVHLEVARDEVRVRFLEPGRNSSRTPGRRCNRMGETCVAPASIAAPTTSRSCSGRSEMPGRIGAIRTPVGMPASVSVRIASSAPADAACRALSRARPCRPAFRSRTPPRPWSPRQLAAAGRRREG